MTAYLIYDTIAEKPVVCFVAQNEADLARFVSANFGRADRGVIDGWDVVCLGEVTLGVAEKLRVKSVLDFLPALPLTKVFPESSGSPVREDDTPDF